MENLLFTLARIIEVVLTAIIFFIGAIALRKMWVLYIKDGLKEELKEIFFRNKYKK